VRITAELEERHRSSRSDIIDEAMTRSRSRAAALGSAVGHACVAWGIALALAIAATAHSHHARAQGAAGSAVLLEIDGPIGPATSGYVHRGLAAARERGARIVILRIDTPGGLDTAMRQIVKDILASPVPVAGFVGPGGARAASAGTFILYASHVAAMAPATNLGAATPVPVGLPGAAPKAPGGNGKPTPATPAEATTAKATNDAVAYIRGLAELRGRNADWAERAVREAASLSAREALAQQVVDLVVDGEAALLAAVHGRTVRTATGDTTLDTKGGAIERFAPDWRTRLLSTLSNPTVALILLLLGVYGLFFEFSQPGFGVPGVVGAIALLLALFALQLLPVNYAGLALMALGLALMVAEAFVPSFGVLGIGGLMAFVAGGIMLFDRDVPGFAVPIAALAGMALASLAVIVMAGRLFVRSRRRPVVSGREELVGAAAQVVDLAPDGGAWVHVHGETWQARAVVPLARGDRVTVTGVSGLTLEVAPPDVQSR
jgi:membrane-bound serine protease (ClpP class)